MTFWESIRIAIRALRANILRSSLTMLGVIIGVAAVITMVSIGTGAHAQIVERIRSMGANLLVVLPGAQSSGGARLKSGSRHTLTEEDADAIARQIAGAALSVPVVQGSAQAVHGNNNWSTLIGGITPDYVRVREWRVSGGRAFTWQDLKSAAKVAVLGATVASRLFATSNPIGQVIRVGNVPFTVVGTLQTKGPSAGGRDQDDVILVPLPTAKLRLLGRAHRVSRRAVDLIFVKAVSPEAVAGTKQQIRALLHQRHRLSPDAEDDFTVRDLAEVNAVHTQATRTLTWLLGAVATVSLVVGGISIMNTMLVSVSERTREIGVRLAVGARRRDIRRQFMVEALALCLVGGVGGIVLGVATSWVVAYLTGWPVLIGPGSVLLAFSFATAVAVFFGLYPALKASRLDPIEALRSE